MSKEPREITLLKAAAAILRKCAEGPYVVSPEEVTVFYDDTDCDGACLLEDIENVLECPTRDTLQAENRELRRALANQLQEAGWLWPRAIKGDLNPAAPYETDTAKESRALLAKEPKT